MPATTRSPSPGMDPWLEPYWEDVHHTVMTALRRQAFGQLPAGLYAAVERTVIYIDADEDDRRVYKPDVAVFDRDDRAGGGTASAAAVAEPIRIVVPTQPTTSRHVEIRELRDGHPLVTAIEVLSPTNKVDARARVAYMAKRAGYYAADANVVEIDLVRAGQHLIDVPLDRVRAASATAAVRRSTPSWTTTRCRSATASAGFASRCGPATSRSSSTCKRASTRRMPRGTTPS